MTTIESIFSKYLAACRNSFDSILSKFDHTKNLFAIPIIVEGVFTNIENKCVFLKSDHGFLFNNDYIIVNEYSKATLSNQISIKLNLFRMNRFFYTYQEIRKGIEYIFYTPRGLSALLNYVCTISNDFNCVNKEKIIGAMTIYTYYSSRIESTTSITLLISTSPDIPNFTPIQIDSIPIDEHLKCSPMVKSLYLRTINLSLYNALCRYMEDFRINYSIQNLGNDIWIFINNNMDVMPDEVIDICAFLFPKKYVYSKNSKIFCQYRDDALIAFNKLMINWYQRGIADMDIPLLFTQEEINEYELLFDKVSKDVTINKYKLSWLDDSDILSIEYIAALYIVQTLIKSDRVQQKAAFAVWLYYMLYDKLLGCIQQEKQMYKILLFHLIGSNHRTFAKFFDRIKFFDIVDPNSTFCKSPHSWKNRDSDICVAELVSYFSDDFNIDYTALTLEQKTFVGKRFISMAEDIETVDSLPYIKHYKQLLNTCGSHTFFGNTEMCKGYASLLHSFIHKMLHQPTYTNKDILDIVDL